MAQATILVVEDSIEVTEALVKMLAPMNYNVITAPDGNAGLQSAINHTPDLIFLDMNMPVMDGLQVLDALRNANCRCPVVFMTAFGSEKIAADAFRLGARDYLRKPFSTDDVQLAVSRALREERLAHQRDVLGRYLQTAEAVRITTVTLAHYLNNYLTVLSGSLQLLEEALERGPTLPEALQRVQESRRSAADIAAVIRVLMRVTFPRFTAYTGSSAMLDIDEALKRELRIRTDAD